MASVSLAFPRILRNSSQFEPFSFHRRIDPTSTHARVMRPEISRSCPEIETTAGGSGKRVFVVSDLHTDYEENMKWVKSLTAGRIEGGGDVLLVAGDVAETYANFVLTMSLLKEKFRHVFFVPGNHDLWLRREKSHDYLGSLEKMDKLLDACRSLGVETKPCMVDGLGIIPLYSWYHESFDEERDITGVRIPSLEMVINFLSPSKGV